MPRTNLLTTTCLCTLLDVAAVLFQEGRLPDAERSLAVNTTGAQLDFLFDEDKERQFFARTVDAAKADVAKAPPKGLIYREASIWKMAVQEATLEESGVSPFGQSVGKFPASWVETVMLMDHKKTIRYNFQGTGFQGVKSHRKWVNRFVRKHFRTGDFLRYTDVKSDPNYTLLGDFDRSRAPGGYRPKDASRRNDLSRDEFGMDYFQVMARSKFTLCPRGDRAFSYRFYEAALTRSIPVVWDIEVDMASKIALGDHQIVNALRCIPYRYYSLKHNKTDLVYRKDWAEENYRLFVKYQTFIEGDNTPPGCPRIGFEWQKHALPIKG